MNINIEDIAKICHETNRAYCSILGDNSQLPWEQAPEWQRQSAINGVKFSIDNPNAPASSSHDSWLKEKEDNGWKYGSIKDEVRKEHPCFVPFKQLPIEQQLKDHLFKSIVKVFNGKF